MKTVAYIRNDTAYLQKNEIENYCKRNSLDLEMIFEDQGTSGLDEERIEYQNLLKYVSKNKVDLIVINKAENLNRNLNRMIELIKYFQNKDIGLVAINGAYGETYLTDREFY